MTDSQHADDAPPAASGKPYSKPTLTEYGNVSKLTMAKGSTNWEIVPKKAKGCL